MNILILNCGSSTLKFQIIETSLEQIEADQDRRLAVGSIERIGGHAICSFQADGQKALVTDIAVRDHREAVDKVLRWVIDKDSNIDSIMSLSDIHAVGHRVVHGAEKFRASVKITDEVIQGIEDCIDLAPLHNPANLKGIRAARELFGTGIPQIAVFDTSFHSTMPETSYLYGIPYSLYRRHKIRRYGFHGTSHRYVAYRYRKLFGMDLKDVDIISLHLGNGCSACAIHDGESIDTSMGFTPLEGLVMGTRSGDLDPSIIEFLTHKEGMTVAEIDNLLNKQSGLLGISGLTSDMRDLLDEEAEHNDRRASLAIDIFCTRIKKYIGAYDALMSGAHAIIFTGGIGENSPTIRTRICAGLEYRGLVLDEEANKAAREGSVSEITTPDSKLKAYVIPTNEELLIARDTLRVIENAPRRW